MYLRSAASFVLLAGLCANPAQADGTLSQLMSGEHTSALDRFDEIRRHVIDKALLSGSPSGVRALRSALDGGRIKIAGQPLKGDWHCRTIKMGGAIPIVVYPWFRCRIDEDGVGLRLEKRGGSQRTRGYFYDLGEDRMAYLGVLQYPGSPAVSYGVAPDLDQFAVVTSPAPGRLRMEFPAPKFDSEFDIMELRRGMVQ